MSYIENPNFPTSKLKSAIVANADSKITEFIKSFGIELFYTESNTDIDGSIAKHADINAFYIGNGKIVLDESQKELKSFLTERGISIIFPEKSVCGAYPGDCKLNCVALGNRIITRVASTDEYILNGFCAENIINVNQGYARCSVCIVNENAVITDDVSIYKACLNHRIEALLISKGNIALPGHNYGFIGGASSLIDKDKLIFFGDITKHIDYERIDIFLNKHGCKYEYLSNHNLTDIGGMILIEEEK